MFYLIGIGFNEDDISAKATAAMKNCDAIYAEFYTNKWHGDLNKLTGKKIEIIDREKTESDFLVNEAEGKTVALLVSGDPLAATTHMELFIEAKKRNITVKIIHAPSVYTAIAETGLQLYKFGRVTTLVKPEKGFEPVSPYDVIVQNKSSGLHTLVLLDIGMTAKDGINLLLNMEKKKKRGIFLDDTMIVSCCCLGTDEQEIKYGSVSLLLSTVSEKTPAALVVPGQLHFKEEEALEMWKC
ncbi:MAG: diphthine synthase [Candidatus Aenigmatarchaeota archaeon]